MADSEWAVAWSRLVGMVSSPLKGSGSREQDLGKVTEITSAAGLKMALSAGVSRDPHSRSGDSHPAFYGREGLV